jgi:peptide/nickel transport system ATP-binding protein
MEIASSSELVRLPMHPYTKLLLAATPGSNQKGALPETSNEPPNLFIDRKGCPFAPRCPLVSDVCRETQPALQEIEPGHWVACHALSVSM